MKSREKYTWSHLFGYTQFSVWNKNSQKNFLSRVKLQFAELIACRRRRPRADLQENPAMRERSCRDAGFCARRRVRRRALQRLQSQACSSRPGSRGRRRTKELAQ